MPSQLVEIVELLASPLHRYEGRPADGPRAADAVETAARIEIRAGLGVVGDRYFGRTAHRPAAVTLQSADALDAVAATLGVAAFGLAETRRNILLRGVDVDALVGEEFALDSGDGPVRFRAHRPANPCGWMDARVAPGAHRALRGRGGIRTEPLSDGVLLVGTATLEIG